MAAHAYSTLTRGRAPLTTRQRLEAAVEAAIAALDAFDGDPDLEPSLGSPEPGYGRRRRTKGTLDQRLWSAGDRGEAGEEREEVSEDEGGACEGEGDHDEREPDDYHMVVSYPLLDDGTPDQSRPLTPWEAGL